MEALKQSRGPLRRAFTIVANALEEALGAPDPDSDNLAAVISQLDEKGERLFKLDREISELMFSKGCSDEDYAKEFDAAEIYVDRFTVCKAKASRLLSRLDGERQSTTASENARSHLTQTTKRKFKLPQIELKKFGGEAREWLGFWAQFKKIHDDPDIDLEDKFQYLIQSTVPKSRAREVVEGFPPSGSNYAKAVDYLQSRFGREDVLVEVYVRELLSLVLYNALHPKENIRLSILYDKLESQLRALESLGVTSDKYAAMLLPLVESCLPEDVLKAWERNRGQSVSRGATTEEGNTVTHNRLTDLMTFLRSEVEGEERILLARSGFGFNLQSQKKSANKIKPELEPELPTAAGLFCGNQNPVNPNKPSATCIFCEKMGHESRDCSQSAKLSLEEKKNLVVKKRCCFVCLRPGHNAQKCKSKLKCIVCCKRHCTIICPEIPTQRSSPQKADLENPTKEPRDATLANQTCSPEVLLQTLIVRLRGKNKGCLVRALIDTGSQKSYISEKAAAEMGYEPIGQEKVTHSLFGGVESLQQSHRRHRVFLSNVEDSYRCNFEVYDQPTICGEVPRLKCGPWEKELRERKITLSDVNKPHDISGCDTEIHVLIGADVAGKLLTGRIHQLSFGPVAVETLLGWTLMGKLPRKHFGTVDGTLLVTSLFIQECKVSDLWRLDCLGIMDPVEAKTKDESQQEAIANFTQTISKLSDGRYEVALPWIEGHPPLPSNLQMVEKRLGNLVKRLRSSGYLQEYQEVLNEWVRDEIIEEVPANEEKNFGHYLPHRAVIKESSLTTKLRPVFDASARCLNSPSLNDCLEKGPNLIELIPSVLNRFRLGRYGVVSDIRRAFLQIAVRERDRDFLRFLWWEDGDENKEKVYRHRRVVFGVSSSPFLLGATLAHHLRTAPDELRGTADKLLESMYVDNCVASLNSEEELQRFILEAKDLLSAARFDLRDWRSNSCNVTFGVESESSNSCVESEILVLGMKWNTRKDTLHCDLRDLTTDKVTKRTILSVAHRVFDPIGFTCPVMLYPKLLLQEAWQLKLTWDEELPCSIVKLFNKWLEKIPVLQTVEIPRCLTSHLCTGMPENLSLHVFCDASKHAYACCVFLRRIRKNGDVCVQLVQARARVAPLKKITIPRLELLACTIGSRLADTVKRDLRMQDIRTMYWTDAADALYWIKSDDQWGTFVWNRVKEIRSLSKPSSWRHVSGNQNPADLPSRGCSAPHLVSTKWWEGPSWLKKSEEEWPTQDIIPSQDVIDVERKKTAVSAIDCTAQLPWYCRKFSSFWKIIRLIAWIYRFCDNASKPVAMRIYEDLQHQELEKAENVLLKIIQKEAFHGKEDYSLKSLRPVLDENGLIRVETRIIMREDTKDFRYPVLLPHKHPAVTLLILWKHRQLSHAGTQVLLAELRERYWILHSRKTIRNAIRQCGRCRRFEAKPVDVQMAPLPKDRVGEAAAFEVTGVDLAGPLFLKGSIKSWIVLFTCAVIRAVHLELITSLSTEAFWQAFRRFVARRGRPKVVYSDNGTNFLGASNALKSINWEEIKANSSAERIVWKFNPPSAAWWGGWWERLVGMMKQLLRRVLGKSSLTYEELSTVLCDCESVLNSRPLTYTSEDPKELAPLTPAMFLQDNRNSVVPDVDLIDSRNLNKRFRYKQKLREDLRHRFRREYLGQLQWRNGNKTKTEPLSIGDIVLVGDSGKRLDWSLGEVTEIFPGRDGQIRLAKVKTKSGTLLRPAQKLFPLEVHSTDGEQFRTECKKSKNDEFLKPCKKTVPPQKAQEVTTRSGRVVKTPQRYSN